jgi:hypothetical protein
VSREVRRTVARLKFDAVNEHRPGVQEGVFTRIDKRAAGEERVWAEYARLAGNHAVVKEQPFPWKVPVINPDLNRANKLIQERAHILLQEQLFKEFFQ